MSEERTRSAQFAKIASGQAAVLVRLVEKVDDFVTVPPVSSCTWDL